MSSSNPCIFHLVLSFRRYAPEFTEDQLRVVIFRDSESRGQRLLFDSSTVKQVPLHSGDDGVGPVPGSTEPCSGSSSRAWCRSRPGNECTTSSEPRVRSRRPSGFVETAGGFGYKVSYLFPFFTFMYVFFHLFLHSLSLIVIVRC
jgi:hypothetical protein